MPKFQRLNQEEITLFFFDWLRVEILDRLLTERVPKYNPRATQKPLSKFSSKKTKYRGSAGRMEPPSFPMTNDAFSLN